MLLFCVDASMLTLVAKNTELDPVKIYFGQEKCYPRKLMLAATESVVTVLQVVACILHQE